LASLVLVAFFYKLVFHANHVYFETGGDGLQTYYHSIYHLKYDESFLYQSDMNYPYGESVMFTAAQPFVLFPLKIFGLEKYTVGIMNLLMLLSIPLSAIFIYLVFKECGQQGYWAILLSIGIAYLSPQIHRLTSHYTLTYQFAIPALMWLLLKFYKSGSYKASFIISFFVFLLASIHLYFFALLALLGAFFYLYVLVENRESKYMKTLFFSAKHFFIQFVLPYILLQVLVAVSSDVHDRTENPWGILLYKSNWNGVFFPFGKWLSPIVTKFYQPTSIPEWEGMAYVGIMGALAFVFITLKLLWNLIVKRDLKQLFRFSEVKPLNYFIVGAFLALLYSFGYPFIFDHEDWLEHVGVLKQLRGIGRFSWLFYYTINIAGGIFMLSLIKNVLIKRIVLAFAVLLLMSEAFQNIYGIQDKLNNHIPELNASGNHLVNNRWLNYVDIAKYQAVIPLPYFFSGSDNIGIEEKGKIKKWSLVTSIKTGLPLLAGSLSRTSMSQVVENIQISREHNLIPKWLKDLPNSKPFLVLAGRDTELRENEKEIIKKSVFIVQNAEFSVYSLPIDSLYALFTQNFSKAEKELNSVQSSNNTMICDGYTYTGDSCSFVRRTFESENGVGFRNGNGTQGAKGIYVILYDDKLPNAQTDTSYTVSVWVNNINKDLYPRSTFIIDVFDSNKVWINTAIYAGLNNYLKRIEGNWGLIETNFKLHHKSNRVKICFLVNNVPKNGLLQADELLIIPSGKNLYRRLNDNEIYKNNRIIHKISK
jgi:hypothetical protein